SQNTRTLVSKPAATSATRSRSPPELNAPSAPVTRTARVSSSALIVRQTPESSRCMSPLTSFIPPGARSVSCRMPAACLRIATLVAGWPETVCGSTIDRQCGSSMQAAFNAAAAIQAGHLDLVVAAGVESMSRVPMGSNLGADGFEGFSPKLYEQWEIVPQGIS